MEFKFLKLCSNTKGTQKQRLKNVKNFYESFSSLVDPHLNNDESFIRAIEFNNIEIAKWLFYDVGGFKLKSILKKSFDIARSKNYDNIVDWLREIDFDYILKNHDICERDMSSEKTTHS